MLYELNLNDGTGGLANQSVYTSRNGVVVTSSQPVYSNSSYYYMKYLFDGKYDSAATDTYWLTNGSGTATLDFDFTSISGKVNRFEKITVYPRTRDESISDYRILAKVGLSDAWVEIVPLVTNTYTNCPYGTAREHVIAAKYNYFRFELTRKDNWGVTLNEIKFLADVTADYRDTELGGAYVNPDKGWKRYDDTYAGISYKVNKPYGSGSTSMHYNADEIRFSFFGTKLRLVYHYNWGNNGDVVYIDGVSYPTTKTNRGTSTLVFEQQGLSATMHDVVIKTYIGSDWFSQFDALEIDDTGYVLIGLGTQILEAAMGSEWKRFSDEQAIYPNGFTPYSTTSTITNMHGGSSRVLTRNASNPVGTQDRIRFRFYGTRLRLLACTYTDRQETMRISIDGIDLGTFTSRYNTANTGQVVVYEKVGMEKKVHEVLIYIDENAASGQFFFDAFDIDNDGYVVGEESAVVPTPDKGWKRYEETHPAFVYFPTAGWANAALAAHSGGTAIGSVTTQKGNKTYFDFIGSKFRLIISKSPTYSPQIRVTIDGTVVRDFSARDSYFYHKVAGFQHEGLAYGRHSVVVEVITKPTNSDGYDFRFDAIDIDESGRMLHPDEVFEQKELAVGKRIRAHYSAQSGTIGRFYGFGLETSDFLPTIQVAAPDGDFYLVAVDSDPLGRLILLADRNLQGGVSWMAMNDAGLMTGKVLDKQLIPTVPILTSNTSDPSVTIEVSSLYGTNYDGWKAFDGLSAGDTRRWIASNPAPSHLTVKYREPKVIKHYSVLSNTHTPSAPKDWQIHGSNDGLEWFLLDSRTNETGLTTEKFYSFDNNAYYSMYRIYITANNGHTGYFSSVDTLQFYEEDTSLSNALIRLPSGGVNNSDTYNEWDYYVTKNTLNGRTTAGDSRSWNWTNSWTVTSNTYPSAGINYRTVRGYNSTSYSYIITTDVSVVNTGFRPLMLIYVAEQGNSSLFCEITVPVKNDLPSDLYVYRDHIEYKDTDMVDVTIPVTATDWKGYAVESSGIYSSDHKEWLAFDNLMTGTYAYAPPANMSSAWLIFDYGKPLNVAGYGIGARPSYPAQAPRSWTFSGSNDKVTWEVLESKYAQPDWTGGELRKFPISSTDKVFRYFKWDISNSSQGTQLGVQEFELYGYDMHGIDQRKTHLVVPYANDLVTTLGVYTETGGTITPVTGDLTLPMTSNTSNGYTVKASGNYTGSSGYNMFQAFNNVAGSGRWSPGATAGVGWLAIDIVDAAVATSYLLEAPTSSPSDMTKTWTFEGSHDGDNWVVLDSRVNEPSWSAGQRREYQITNPSGAFRWFRINSTANYGGWLTIGEIEIYGMRGAYYNQRKSFITVPYANDFPSSITVKPHGRMKARAKVSPVYLADLATTIDVKWTSNIVSNIAVRPKGKMRAVVNVIPPPKIESVLSPIKDAFVRSGVPRLNYGQEQEMLVGKIGGEAFNSLIQFDLSTIPANMKLLSAKLRLYVEQTSLVGNPVSLYQIENDWAEIGVTWASAPAYGQKLTEIYADVAKEYAEVDLLDVVKGWYSGTLDNKGMFLNLDTIADDIFVRFGTRERGTGYAPQLIVEYQDPAIRSYGYGEVISHITARQNKYKDLATKITVKSYWDKTELAGSLKVFNPDMLESSMRISRGDMYSRITVKRSDTAQLPSTITVTNKRDSVLETNVKVSRDFMDSTLIVRRSDGDNLPSVIVVRNTDDEGIPTQLDVTRPDMPSGIEVTASSVLTSSITVTGADKSELESVITVRRSESKDLNSTVEVWKNSDIDGSITVKSGYLRSSIVVPFGASKDLVTKIRVAERYASDLVTHIEIGGESDIVCTIVVVESDDGGYAFIL